MAKHAADLQIIERLRCENAFGGTNGRSVCVQVRARLKGRIRCVFEHQLRSLSVLGTRNLTCKEQGHIDSRGYALRGYQFPFTNPPIGNGFGSIFLQKLERRPVRCGSRIMQQTRSGKDY